MEEKGVSVGDSYSGRSDNGFFTQGKFYSITRIISRDDIGGESDATVRLTCDDEGYEYVLPVKLLNDKVIFTKIDNTNPVNLMKLLFDTIKE